VTANLVGLPAGLWVSHVEASPHDEATAHLTVDGHRSGDMTPYVYRTTDFGATWESITGEGLEGFAHVVVQDLVNPDLIFGGTEFGLYSTLDAGMQWARFAGHLPPVPGRDLDRIYILDDLTPLRHLTEEVLESNLALLPARDSVMTLGLGLSWFEGNDEFVGDNPPEAASIFFYQRKRHIFGDLKLEVYDEDGELISSIPAPKFRGLNRADWPMRLPPPKMPPATNLVLGMAMTGPRVPEGSYSFKLVKGKDTYEGTVKLMADPRSPHSAEDRLLQQKTALELYDMLGRLTYVVDSLIDLEEKAKSHAEELGGSGRLATRLESYSKELEDLRGSLVSTSKAGCISGDEKLREKMGNVYGAVNGYDGRPTQSQLDRTLVLAGKLEAGEELFKTLTTSSTVTSLNSQLEDRGLEQLEVMSREAWDEKQEEGGAGSTAPSARSLARLMESGALLPLLR
jgi:hypothetical protein